ncbi:hypothetical protein F2P81_014380 [Scophthalmus maximus]|uniref:Yippee domain-containing protein n=1 Tax=Scophthalmus maximus TaxID=52904 RepID=A0A6A4STF2_SCOMX|nr:hypothetical protein F2P81_014380 [Scophthalmus maximus]
MARCVCVLLEIYGVSTFTSSSSLSCQIYEFLCHHSWLHITDVFNVRVGFPAVASVWSVPHTHSTTTTAFACILQCFFCQQVQQSCNSSSASPDACEEPGPTDMVKMTKSKTFQAYLPSCHRTYSCIHCRAHLANHDELISKISLIFFVVGIKPPPQKTLLSLSLLRRHVSRRAVGGEEEEGAGEGGEEKRLLTVGTVKSDEHPQLSSSQEAEQRVNVGCGPAEERVLLTGLHAVADIYCENCKTTLGWKYEHAFESSQKYKEGKFIIELAHMIKDNGWE